MPIFIRTVILSLGLVLACEAVVASPVDANSHYFDLSPYLYTTLRNHGDGRIFSAFVPYQEYKNSCWWWDTGTLWWGTGVGYRRVLSQRWLNQDWFVGAYGYFDIMNQPCRDFERAAKDFNAALDEYPAGPIRLNVGVELCAAQWGQMTVNVYGVPFSQANIMPHSRVQELIGISGRLTFNYSRGVQPLFCMAYTALGESFSDPHLSKAMSVGLGCRLIVSYNLECEFKGVWGEQQTPVHLGIQWRLYDAKKAIQPYFKRRLVSPPERYIPTYYNEPAKFFSGSNSQPGGEPASSRYPVANPKTRRPDTDDFQPNDYFNDLMDKIQNHKVYPGLNLQTPSNNASSSSLFPSKTNTGFNSF